MRCSPVFILCMLLIASAAIAGAVGKQTVDPNSGGSVTVNAADQTDAGSTWDSDQRLSKAITYSAHRRMLYQILDDLGKQTGVLFSTGRSSTDWRTRELRMNLAVKDIPLKDLMMSIARVMKLKWIRSTLDGKAAYRLVGEKPPAPEETPEEKAARELAQRRRDFFNQYMGLAQMSTSELNRLQYSNPNLYALAKTPFGIPFAKLLANSPAASMALIEGRQLTLRGNDIPLTAANELLAAIQATSGVTVDPGGKPMVVPHGVPVSADALSVQLNPATAAGGTGLGDVSITCNGRSVPISFADPAAAPAKALNLGAPASTPTAKAKPAPEPDPVAVHPDEPDLHKKIKLQSKDQWATLDVIQAALAEASGFSVVSDSFDGPSATQDVPKDELELKDCLDRITATSGQNWEKKDRIVEMRDRNWAAKRELLIPGTTLRKWHNALKSDGTLPKDVLAEIHALPQSQFNTYVNTDNDLSGVADAVNKAFPLVP